MILTMNNLEKCFENAKKENATWVAVAVKTPNCESSELILNPNVNFDTKLDYYRKAYDFELSLKACKDIKIVGFTFGDTLEEIESYLFEDGEPTGDKQINLTKEDVWGILKDKIWYIVYPGFWLGYPTSLAYAYLGNKIALYIAIVFTIILISCIMYVIIGALNHPKEFVEAFAGDDDDPGIGAGF